MLRAQQFDATASKSGGDLEDAGEVAPVHWSQVILVFAASTCVRIAEAPAQRRWSRGGGARSRATLR